MMPDPVWLSKSLFCAEKNWRLLLTQGIRPFISGLTRSEMQYYQLQFNQTYGENIRLALLTTPAASDQLGDKLDQYFTEFFQSLEKIDPGIPEDSLYIPFPQNTVQYGLYDLLYREDLMTSVYKIQEDLSGIIINNIDEREDTPSRLMLTFKLHIAAIKASLLYYPEGILQLLDAYQPGPETNIPPEFIEMGSTLSNGILNNSSILPDDDQTWLRSWIAMCEQLLQEELRKDVDYYYSDADRVRSVHIGLVSLIDRHMGARMDEIYFIHSIIIHVLTAGSSGKTEPGDPDIAAEKQEHYLHVVNTRNIFQRIDNTPIGDDKDEIRLFVIARNESLRLPYFLEFYSRLGVDRIFLLDNNSTDDTREIALQKENVHVFKIDEGFRNHWYWMEYFLEEYGKDHWCMTADVDELFHFPFSEHASIRDLIGYLERHNYTAIRSVLLDMYSDKPIVETVYDPASNPLELCPYFDKYYYNAMTYFFDKKKWEGFQQYCHFGGMRDRVFGYSNDGKHMFCLSKIPLFKYSADTYLVPGMHAINGAAIADIEGAVMHTKFFNDFIEKANVESIRQEHYRNGYEYKIYNEYVLTNRQLTLKDERSIRFTDTRQLTALGLMKSSEKFEKQLTPNRN